MIQVLDRALKILAFVAEKPEEPKGLGVLAGYVGLNEGTCANIVKALCEHNLLEQVGRKKGYILGPRVYFLARNGPYRKDIVSAVEPLLIRLASDVRETVLVATLHGGKKSILLQVNGNNMLSIKREFLLQEGVYNTSTGRLLLAFFNSAELEGFIKRKGLPDKKDWPEATTPKKLKEALSLIRKKGMAVDITKQDIIAFAFPIKQDDRVIAALGLFLLSPRFKGKRKEYILNKAKETSEKMSETITSL
jgi:DNA-binding IclR family transcriptional regulator